MPAGVASPCVAYERPERAGDQAEGTRSEARGRALPRLFISHLPEHDWLIALEFGRVDEGQPADRWRGITQQLGLLFDEHGRCVGFKALEFSAIDLASDEYELAWNGPRFCAPTLALADASAPEVILAARAFFGDRQSVNRTHFNHAVGAVSPGEALAEWHACIESGDCMAHYGLGIAYADAGDFQLAYKHLRFYTSIAPEEGWAHYWFARAALAVGADGEARAARDAARALATDFDLRAAVDELDDLLDGD